MFSPTPTPPRSYSSPYSSKLMIFSSLFFKKENKQQRKPKKQNQISKKKKKSVECSALLITKPSNMATFAL